MGVSGDFREHAPGRRGDAREHGGESSESLDTGGGLRGLPRGLAAALSARDAVRDGTEAMARMDELSPSPPQFSTFSQQLVAFFPTLVTFFPFPMFRV